MNRTNQCRRASPDAEDTAVTAVQNVLEKRSSLHRQLAGLHRQNEQLRSQVSLLQSLANVGLVLHMIAHEINNLLTPLAGYAEFALANPDDKNLAEKALTRTIRYAARAKQIQESLLALANGERLLKKNCRLRVLIDEIFSSLCRDFARDRITVTVEVPDDLQVWAVPVQIQQVLMNLILNARQAMLPAGGLLSIKAGWTVDKVWVRVSDAGPGLGEAELAKIFEPFYTTKDQEGTKGSGLGLTFCKHIVEAHDGFLSVESEPGKGACFEITLPKPATDANGLGGSNTDS